MPRAFRWAAAALAVALAVLAAATATAAPTFPALTGRVVDDAAILSPQVETELTGKLEALERQTGRQLVVVTLPSLQGYEIEDFGYQLGRAWGVGGKADNDGVLFIVAPKERKVGIEVGYGLEPVLTDALSSVILQERVLPRFRAGDMQAGVVDGTQALIDQLALPPDQARARAASVAEAPADKSRSGGIGVAFLVLFVVLVMLSSLGGRRRRSGLGEALPWILLGALNSGRRGGSDSWGGGGWSGGGGGGFSGGGGSFGGGGSSGSW